MSRHSKWAKIKRQKSITDVKRGQLFTKLVRAIMVAAREGGGDPTTNVRLRMAVDRALTENMTKENIQRAIDRATGADAESAMTSVILEGYGPGGAALIIEAITDNRNRTVSDIRKILGNAGGSLGDAGSTQWMFERRGRLLVEHITDPDAAELAAIDAGALDTDREETTLEVLAPADELHTVADRLTARGFPPTNRELILVSTHPLPLSPTDSTKLHALSEELGEHDDVLDVTTNAVEST